MEDRRPTDYPGDGSPDEEIDAARAGALERLLNSAARLKVAAAGPGTGKTYTFKKVVEQCDGRVLVFTFLTNLVKDLENSLGEGADVFSFHGFAKQQLYQQSIEGIGGSVDYYPAAELLYEGDLSAAEIVGDRDDIADALMNLKEDSPVLAMVLRSGSYYNTVGHNDAVYRVLRTFQREEQGIPAYAQVLVDEYQDFSRLEVELIECLAQVSPTLIVGDDDQALYYFRHASPEFIRHLINGDVYETFELPYCTRCTPVIVDATHRVVDTAQAQGLLQDRLPKPYLCHLPSKREDGKRYPKIIHTNCTVDSKATPYIAKYIIEEIKQIDPEEIAESRKDGYPTVLIIGPKQYTRRIGEVLGEAGYDVSARVAPKLTVHPLDGYRRIALHEKSRLGWRILLHYHQPASWPSWIAKALIDDAELYDELDPEYRGQQLQIARLIGRIKNGEDLSPDEQRTAAAATALTFDELKERLGVTAPDDEPIELEVASESDDGPSIMLASMVSSKGLQAQHVFVVGVNEGSLPHDNANIDEQEVCELLVALTRTKKSCTLISCGRFSGNPTKPSKFIEWLEPLLEHRAVNKNTFK